MWAVAVFLLSCVHLISGKTTIPEYKGCYSTKSVNQHSSYYKINLSLTIEQCVAACNHRLTRYMGLQVDESWNGYNFGYCGNDLTEVSLKLDDSECSICQENRTLSCGSMNSMSIYFLRESTPLALLLHTNRGIELLIDNITTITVSYNSSSSNQHLDYIYTDGLVFSVMNTGLLRFSYDNIGMNYTQPVRVLDHDEEPTSFAVDFIDKNIFYVFKDDKILHKTDIRGSQKFSIRGIDYVAEHISIDPYNRILTFVNSVSPHNSITIVYFPMLNTLRLPLSHWNVAKVIALTMDLQEKHMYAIVNLLDDPSTHLVRFDYGVTYMEVLLQAPQLANATVLEVFRGHIVWLRNANSRSTIFMCKLKPMCLLKNITSYSSTQTVYDFTIYHPEKQTPGRKRLCADLNCSHGCYTVSLFMARCFCPPGMELDSDKTTCNNVMPSSKASTTQATTSIFRDESDLAKLSTPSSCAANTSKINENLGPVTEFHVYFIMICIVINLVLLIGIGILVLKGPKKVSHGRGVSQPQLELINSYDVNPGHLLLD